MKIPRITYNGQEYYSPIMAARRLRVSRQLVYYLASKRVGEFTPTKSPFGLLIPAAQVEARIRRLRERRKRARERRRPPKRRIAAKREVVEFSDE